MYASFSSSPVLQLFFFIMYIVDDVTAATAVITMLFEDLLLLFISLNYSMLAGENRMHILYGHSQNSNLYYLRIRSPLFPRLFAVHRRRSRSVSTIHLCLTSNFVQNRLWICVAFGRTNSLFSRIRCVSRYLISYR